MKVNRNHGVDIEITAIADKRTSTHLTTLLYDSGILFSVASKSLLKRFIIRPTGVVSKNSIFVRKIE